MFDELSSEDEKKKWLFKENVRLQELSRNLEDERKLIEIQMGMLQRQQSKNMLLKKQLESQRDLFEQKWNILERETRQLAIDKDKFEREKIFEMRKLASDRKYTKDQLKTLLSKYLNNAVSERITKLETRSDQLFSSLNDGLPERERSAVRSELNIVLNELKALKMQLYSESDISKILHEPDVVAEKDHIDADAPFSLCLTITSEIRDLEEKLESLRRLQDVVC